VLVIVVNGHQALHSRMGCSSSNVLTPSGKRPKTLLRAYEIPVTPVLGASEQLDLESSSAWETCSWSSWEVRKEHVVGDKRVPLPPSSRMDQKHRKRLEHFFDQVGIRQEDFKRKVARRRLKLDAKSPEDQHSRQVATSIVPINVDPQRKCQDFSAIDCHITPICRSESSTTCRSEQTLPGCLEF